MKTLKQRFVKLSWFLLEAKVLYYLFPEFCELHDCYYDALEKEYLHLCEQLQLKNTIQSMVGIDVNRPSVQFAILKLRENGFKMTSLDK